MSGWQKIKFTVNAFWRANKNFNFSKFFAKILALWLMYIFIGLLGCLIYSIEYLKSFSYNAELTLKISIRRDLIVFHLFLGGVPVLLLVFLRLLFELEFDWARSGFSVLELVWKKKDNAISCRNLGSWQIFAEKKSSKIFRNIILTRVSGFIILFSHIKIMTQKNPSNFFKSI